MMRGKTPVFFVLTVVLLASILFAGCSSPAPAPTGPASTSAAVPEKVYKLKAHFWIVSPSNTASGLTRALDLIEQKSKGRIKFDRTWSGTVVTQAGALDAISQDVTDVSYIFQGLMNTKTPLSSIACNYGAVNKVWAGMAAWSEEFSKVPAIQEEWAKYNAIPAWPTLGPPATLLSRNEIPTADKVKGVRFYGVGLTSQLIGNLGGVPSTMNGPDVYDAVSKGTFDAVWFPAVFVPQYRWHEILKHWYANTGAGNSIVQVIALNKRTMESLPKDLQDIMLSGGKDMAEALYDEVIFKTMAQVKDTYAKNNVVTHNWAAADLTKLQQALSPITENRLKELETAGVKDVRKTWDQWVQLNKKYDGLWPDKAKAMGWDPASD
jgi:TRAP-type C4-dicarboxylate transport system substrate-binding protein